MKKWFATPQEPIQNKNLLPIWEHWQQGQTGECFTIVCERMRATERAENITYGEKYMP